MESENKLSSVSKSLHVKNRGREKNNRFLIDKGYVKCQE